MAAASLADPQSLNMYSYVGNDPVNRVDPDGQFWGALFKFIVGLFKSAKPNVINGSFTYRNTPPISVAFTPNFQNISVGFAGIGFDLRTNGNWLPAILGSGEYLDPQGPVPGSFQDCFVRSRLSSTGPPKDQYADARHFTQEAANLLLDIHNAEGTSLSLLAVTLMNENTFFNLYLKPNTNPDKKGNDSARDFWDVGPFQLNQRYTNKAIANKTVSIEGLAMGDVFGAFMKKNSPFTGSPLANGQLAARRLQAFGNNDRDRAINYAGREGRGASYDAFAPLFDRFFNCYKR
jgi:hypothetical protein